LAARTALLKTRLPMLEVKSDDEGEIEIELKDDLSKFNCLNLKCVPFTISLFKIGHQFVVDCDLKEESVSKVKITVGLDIEEKVRFFYKAGPGSLDPDTLFAMIDVILS
jgi:exosome complex RNA-binding protein Rrp42 (RNase PH superfamily)